MKNILVIVIGLALLAGLFWWMKPAAIVAPPTATTTSAPAPEAPGEVAPAPASPAPQVFELVVNGGKLARGPAVISVRQGSAIILRLTVDHRDELHLHGYDLGLELEAGKPAELSFIADRSGRFEYELHRSHLELGALEVQPR